MTRFLPAAVALLLTAAPAIAQPAAESLPPGAKVVALEVKPAAVALDGPFQYTQLLVTAKLDNGETVDATRIAQFTLPGKLITHKAGLVRPAADGKGDISIVVGEKSLRVPVEVRGATADPAVSFVRDVQPVLSKLGCNAGTCHGAQAGKNGFKLSLRGYDAIFDYRALTDDLESRRINRAAPERSLLLLKTSGAVPHQGGVLTQPGEPNYEVIRRWVAQGAKLDLDAVRVKSIDIFPKNPTLTRIGTRQQFAVIATYADGRTRDVTAEAFIDSSNTEVVAADRGGVVTGVRRGEATMLARYEGAYAASTVIVLGDRAGFVWEQRPVQNWIDELVDRKLKQVMVQASPLCTDEEFVRRVFLDLTGLPPEPEDVRAFLADARPSPAKRDALIDRLVGSEQFIEHWTNKWADLLQVNRKFLGDVGASSFRGWIRNALATNQPYDKFAHDILTASGSNVANPPASYYKVLRAPDAVMENTTQLFLAVRFNCNKCHDHPFERWTQDNYYNLAAYFAQVKLNEDPAYKGQRIGGTAVETAKALVEVVSDGTTGEIKHDRTGEVAAPRFPFVINADVGPAAQRRQQAAKWITSAENPYFARSYVNRLWGYLLGVGLIEPIDDIRAGNPPTNPELLDRMTTEFVKSGFDVRAMIRTICKSRTYQLSIGTNKWNRDDDINYSHALARRLPAEVLYDSIHRVTGSVSRLPGLPPGSRAALLPDSNVDLPGGFLDLFGKPVRESACECERTGGMNLGPVLAMVNGPIVGDALKDPNNRLAKLVTGEKDDAKVVNEIYLAVLARQPSAKEREAGVSALRAAGPDHARILADYKVKADAFAAYKTTLDGRQTAWEQARIAEKPTAWMPLEVVKAESKQGPTPASLKDGATLTIGKDGSILASGKSAQVDVYTVVGKAKIGKAITAVRIETLSDPALPNKGPGRAENGNFVLNELKLTYQKAGKDDAAKPAVVRLTGGQATIQQDGFPVGNAVDNNPATGWAVGNGVSKNQAALFKFQSPVPAVADGVTFTATLDQRFGTSHVVGKFRLSVTADANPKLTSPLSAAEVALLETPAAERTDAQKARLRAMYLAQDREYQRLAADAADVPPTDPRVLGAQDLAWALINTPAFLFNR
ncbi:DUF1549 domain-containing protein [Urbifossiella limnaea]|uniref:DUF1549 domain-containing protein n=1 Tax=Urbifossiella limnaea TaxID=2528023 RepID=UPI0011A8EF3D|nr:DUF1549 domain-containing protein [Urbifossiella limnaea]